MAYKGKHPSKFEYAQYIAASLAYLMLHQLDAVGLALHDTKLRRLIPPKSNSKHLLQLLRALEKTQPGGETEHGAAVARLAEQFKRRGLVVILSDCFDQLPALMRALQHFRHHRHEVLLFHILAPEEIEFPFKKWTQFRNLEVAGHKLLVDPQRLRKEYRKNFDQFCKELREPPVGPGRLPPDCAPTSRWIRPSVIYLTKRQRRAGEREPLEPGRYPLVRY